MSNHKDLGKSFASGHGLLTLAGRGAPGDAEENGDTAKQLAAVRGTKDAQRT